MRYVSSEPFIHSLNTADTFVFFHITTFKRFHNFLGNITRRREETVDPGFPSARRLRDSREGATGDILQKLCNIHRKTHVLESLFNKVAGIKF